MPKISLKGIKTGVYLLKIKGENKEFTQKLVIK
uniref:T9SS type A sorting domain-containing protein n=1 Tax=candidate division WOR-3 bacterium TaxID=2052148 RepID=A0A7C3UP53_UNCW3